MNGWVDEWMNGRLLSSATHPPIQSSIHPLLALLPLLAIGCRLPWSAPAPANPVALLKAADAVLADMAFTNVAEWPGARLFDYMNGAAEGYFKHRFVTLASAETKLGKTDARVELFVLKAPTDATALFDEGNDGKGKPLAAGVAGTFWEGREMEALFHRGPFFCRLIIYGSSPEAHKLLAALAAAIDKCIGQ